MLEISINAVFLEEQSNPEDAIFLWAYHIKIINQYDAPVVIKKRVFEVIDSFGQKQIIEGVGIFNNEPQLLNHEVFEYASGVLLNSPSGFFSGVYIIQKENGTIVEEKIPCFSLDSKYDFSKTQ